MERDRLKDGELFNCQYLHEINYVAGLYTNQLTVFVFLSNKCKSHQLYYSTYLEIYELIKEELKLPMPR